MYCLAGFKRVALLHPKARKLFEKLNSLLLLTKLGSSRWWERKKKLAWSYISFPSSPFVFAGNIFSPRSDAFFFVSTLRSLSCQNHLLHLILKSARAKRLQIFLKSVSFCDKPTDFCYFFLSSEVHQKNSRFYLIYFKKSFLCFVENNLGFYCNYPPAQTAQPCLHKYDNG